MGKRTQTLLFLMLLLTLQSMPVVATELGRCIFGKDAWALLNDHVPGIKVELSRYIISDSGIKVNFPEDTELVHPDFRNFG